MNNDEDQSRIKKLEEQLYSRDYAPEEDKRTEITSQEVEGLQTGWQNKKADVSGQGTVQGKKPKKEGFFIKWILILSVLFFLVSFVIAAVIFLKGNTGVSSRNVDVRILGPVSIGGGEELSLEVIVDNKNNVDMEAATVFVEYPDGTRSSENINDELSRDNQDYGPIGSGRNVRKTFKSVLFGEQDSVKDIKVVVEYRVRGSSATFEKEKNYEIQISSSPVLVNIEYPSEVRSNQNVEFVVDIVSNSNTTLNDVLFRAEYPFGFVFEGSDPDPTHDTDIFTIGELEPEEKVTIKIRGMLQAQDNEERTFRFNVGTKSDSDDRELGAVYVASSETVKIIRPGLGLSATVNGSQSNQVSSGSGRNVSTVISWINSLSTRVVNADINVSLSGQMIDRGSVVAGNGGFYRSSTDTISWDQNSQRDLAEITTGQRGSVGFDFDIQALSTSLGSSVRNPEIQLAINVEGTRFSEGNVPEQIESTVNKTIRLVSDFDVTARAVRTVGPIENMGPLPPKVDQTTTYTIIWSITNSYNDAENVRLVAQLPAYVEWEGIFSPSTENIFFNQTTNQIIWEIDKVSAGAGFSTSPREVAFRVAMTPSLSQIGESPSLIGQLSAQGRDDFAGVTLSDLVNGLSTRLTSDPGVTESQSKVVQ